MDDKCITCGCQIQADRLEFLVDLNKPITCVQHSQESQKLALMDYAHKTAGSIVVLPDDKEAIRRAFRVYKRSRS